MARFDAIALHPLPGAPYDKISYLGTDHHSVPVYSVKGSDRRRLGAHEAIKTAFALHGGICFYCQWQFEPQPLSQTSVHRDHVIARKRRGSDRLHNYVIACARCDRRKADKPLSHFDPDAATRYVEALERHIARALGAFAD
ncbi:MAG TPA: HNH endonuclease [Allosphingosinicella sp.]|jgi:5-methylcytosine-specific restriction endonuclease McrA